MSVDDARSRRVPFSDRVTRVTLTDRDVTLKEFVAVARFGAQVELGAEFVKTLAETSAVVGSAVSGGEQIYGVTPGFGDNITETVSPEDSRPCKRTSCALTRSQWNRRSKRSWFGPRC